MIRINGGQATLGANTFTGAQVAPSLALGGATIGSNALAVTGTATFSSTVYVTGFAAALRLGDAASNAYLNINRDAPTGEFFYDSAQTTFAGHRFKVTGTNVLSVLGGSVIVAQPLVFGGTTSSFPSIKRNSTTLNFRLADDSADAPITAAAATFSGTLNAAVTNLTFPRTSGGPLSFVDSGSAGDTVQVGWGAGNTAQTFNLYKSTANTGGTAMLATWSTAGLLTISSLTVSGATTIGGALTVPGVTTAALTSTGTFTSGAAAQVGTLTNAPAAGNPTTWIKIIDNGVTRYIPAW